jgi:filamentous hemagglutinin
MAVGMGIDQQGALRTVIGTSEEGGYLRPGVMLNDGENLAEGFGHAERDVLGFMDEKKIDAWVVGATRPICPACAAAIADSGAEPATPLQGAG